jgi:steroid delta-isomerase-like uncharacterized protein
MRSDRGSVAESNESVVRRFYEELWNEWHLDLAEEILSEALVFRGSLGSIHSGRDEFKHYVEKVRTAFPDWHNQIDAILAIDDRAVARMTWRGTHLGKLGERDPTGACVEYSGVALFRLSDGVIEEAWVVGDTQELWRVLDKSSREATSLEPEATGWQGAEVSHVGEMESQVLDLGEMVCARHLIPAGFDSAPLYRGLPDDMCPCEHWCYLVSGALRYRFTDGETYDARAGDSFHLKAGHLADVLEDSELIEFTRTEDYRRKAAHLASIQVTGEP